MRERQRWRPEEDALLFAYVKQYGSKEWHLMSQRMNAPLHRDPKSCLERWKNYLRPGIKKESLTEEEQRLVIQLQAKHGNKWKKIAAEIPGRTAKRLGKWWEVFKEKEQRKLKERNRAVVEPIDQRKYDRILENFAEKLVKERLHTSTLMAAPLFPPWLSSSNGNGAHSSLAPPSPSVTLTLRPSTMPSTPVGWMQGSRSAAENGIGSPGLQQPIIPSVLSVNVQVVSELVECCRDLGEGHKAWIVHKKEAAWRLRRVELQLESEKACKKREKMEEIESKIRKLKEEQNQALERIEAEYRDQISGLRRDAAAKEQKVAEQWAAKHTRVTKFLEQLGYDQWHATETHGL